jgi:hypothetical protein
VEWGKNVLIVLLACSALWLTVQSQLFGPLSGLLEGESDTTILPEQYLARTDAARPLRMSAALSSGGEVVRYGTQYDTEETDALFQKTASLLMEALSGAGAPEQIDYAQWEQAQNTAPGVTFDFQGDLPLEVLAGWMTGTDIALTGTVRQLTLAAWQDGLALYYRDTDSGAWYRRPVTGGSQSHLAEVLSGLTGNGAVYAFEAEPYEGLAPDTLVTEMQSGPIIYTATNPMSGGRAALEALMTDLGISVDASSFYLAGTEQVARSGGDTLRLSDNGTAVYDGGEEENGRFQIADSGEQLSLFAAVEACRQMAAATVGARCGEARLYLMSAQEGPDGLEVRFGYSLNGSVVSGEEDCAAYFLVRNGRIAKFQLQFRCYTDSGAHSAVMPPLQAAAALSAMGLEGEELLLVYHDAGGDTATAFWGAGSQLAKGG